MRFLSGLCFLAVVVLGLAACELPVAPDIDLSPDCSKSPHLCRGPSLVVQPEQAMLAVGDTLRLSATYEDGQSRTNWTVSWSWSAGPNGVISINRRRLVRALRPGSDYVEVTATSTSGGSVRSITTRVYIEVREAN